MFFGLCFAYGLWDTLVCALLNYSWQHSLTTPACPECMQRCIPWASTYKFHTYFFLITDAVKTLVCLLVLSRIAILYSQVYLSVSLRRYNLCKMLQQRWFRAPKSDHVSPLLQKPHCLPISSRIGHKISSLCYSSLSGTGPQYLSDLIQMYTVYIFWMPLLFIWHLHP